MQFWKGSKYIRIGTVQGFCICNVTQGSGCLNMAELCLDKLLTVAGLWIWLVKVSQAFEYDSGSEQQDSEFGRVTQCAEYVLKCLIMPKYIRINSSRYARILNVSDAVQSVRSLYKLLSSYWSRRLFRHCHRFKIERITKRIMPEC